MRLLFCYHLLEPPPPRELPPKLDEPPKPLPLLPQLLEPPELLEGEGLPQDVFEDGYVEGKLMLELLALRLLRRSSSSSSSSRRRLLAFSALVKLLLASFRALSASSSARAA